MADCSGDRHMLTLSLLRHAKSSWDEPDLPDHERTLSKRGTKAATEIGRYIERNEGRPELILSSDSVRTRATVSLVLAELSGNPPEVVFDEGLYLALPAMILERLRKVKGGLKHVMVVGHNPGLHALALSLTGSGDHKAIQKMAMKFPTAGLAVITFDADDWNAIKPAAGTLKDFIIPRELA